MASTNKTQNISLSQFMGQDKPAWLTDYNEDMRKIDAAFDSRDNTNSALEGRVSQLEADIQKVENNITDTNNTVSELSKNFTNTSKDLQDKMDELIKQVTQNAVAIQNLQDQINNLLP